MEEKSLRVYTDKKFFAKITNTITKLLIPTAKNLVSLSFSILSLTIIFLFLYFLYKKIKKNKA